VLAAALGAVPSLALAAEAPAAGQPESVQRTSEPPGSAETQLDLSDRVPRWMLYEVLGVALWQFAAAFLFVLVGSVLRKVSDHVFKTRVIPWLKRTPYAFDDLLAEAASGPVGMLFLLLGLFGAFAVLPLPTAPDVRGFVFGTLRILVAADAVWFLFRVVDVVSAYLLRLAGRTESKLDDQLVPVIRKALKATIGIIGFVWVAQLLGYSVSSLIAGLGIGGVAVALALQDTLGNFFGSIFIFLDRPFTVGDWIRIGDIEGIVEDIGFRSTRVRTWPATLVSVPNKTVAAAAVDNWSKMPKRRVMQTVGVTYDTRAPQMEEAVAGIRRIIENDEAVDQDFMLVSFTDFGESSLDILVYYFTVSTAWADHLATKQRINLAIMRLLEGMGLSIAFPTRTVHLRGEPGREGAPQPDASSSIEG
jgi:MscS family membrane protein